MKQHKYDSLVKFVHLDGIKEFKETDPSLFSKDGVSTATIEVDNGKNAPVTMQDVKHACEMFVSNELTLHQLQQWGEWIHMMDFFDLIMPEDDETLIDVITELDCLDQLDIKESISKVDSLLDKINIWMSNH